MGIRARDRYLGVRCRACKGVSVDWHLTVFEVVDMRSFSNLWYWIALAVVWSTASHWVLGVPFDMVSRARRQGGQAEADLQELVRINCDRMLYIVRVAGLWLTVFVFFFFTGLVVLGFGYGVEFAQATFLLLAPLAFVWAMGLRAARQIRREGLRGEALRRRLRRLRFWTQVVGMVAIFVTSLWGMYQNMAVGPWSY